MYLSFYGLEINPFDKGIDSKNAYVGTDLQILENRLEFLKEHPSIALFTGLSGMGKTFSIRKFMSSLNSNIYKCIYISMSSITVLDFYKQLAYHLGIVPAFRKVDIFKQIQETIVDLVKNKKIKVIICIDEAQYLKTDILNDLKMLTNFEMDSKNYLTLILTGQPILNDILNRNVHEALRQRITVSYNLMGLAKEELPDYINTRIMLAHGNQGIFNQNAIESIWNVSNGSIRIINNVITKSLIIGSKNSKSVIDNEVVLEAIQDLSLG